jgi:hypothetical protein
MRVECTDKKTFELLDGLEKLGQIAYDSLFSFKAKAVAGSEDYEINSTGFFSTMMSVTKNGVEVANMQMNWKGQVILSFKNGQEYILKPTGMFLNKYMLEDKYQQKIILLDPDFNWSQFTYSYNISYDNKPKDILLILLATYAANYMAMMSSGAM